MNAKNPCLPFEGVTSVPEYALLSWFAFESQSSWKRLIKETTLYLSELELQSWLSNILRISESGLGLS